MSKRNILKKAAYFGIILLLVLVMIFSGLQILESTVFPSGQGQGDTFVSKTITRNGVDYFPRQDITVLMVMGIDQYGPVVSSESYNNSGSADMVMLLIFDEQDRSCSALCLNRDTMMEIPVLGIGGKKAGTFYGQLALAHSYGSGLEDSCENTRDAVSNFLNGIAIDHYVAMNMDAISILNDAVGGVRVNVTDDFSAVDPTITMGETVLYGDQAINFVRTRRDVGNQLNISRMERQREYVDGFVEAFWNKLDSSDSFVVSTYDSVSPYIVTDCSVNTISGMMERYVDYEIKEIVSVEGENVLGDVYYEFYVDEQKLDELILRLFYAPK